MAVYHVYNGCEYEGTVEMPRAWTLQRKRTRARRLLVVKHERKVPAYKVGLFLGCGFDSSRMNMRCIKDLDRV